MFFEENVCKRFNKARNKVKKCKVSGSSTKDSKNLAGNIDGYDFLSWLVQFISSRRTKSNISIQDEPENVLEDDENEMKEDFEEGLNLLLPLDEDNSVSACAKNLFAKPPCMTNQAARPSICETTPHSTTSKAESTGTTAITRKQIWKKGVRVSNQEGGSKDPE